MRAKQASPLCFIIKGKTTQVKGSSHHHKRMIPFPKIKETLVYGLKLHPIDIQSGEFYSEPL